MIYPDVSEELLERLKELGIEPISLLFYPPGFQHPRLLDPEHYVPPTRQGLLTTVAVIAAVLSTMFAALKLSARRFVLHQFGWEDVVLFIAWAFGIGACSLSIWSAKDACMGLHLYDCSLNEIKDLYKFQYSTFIITTLALGLTRSAILIFLWNLVPVTETTIRRVIIALHVVNIGNWGFVIFPIIFQCYPRTMRLWDLEASMGCIETDGYVVGKLSIGGAAIGAAIDFTMLLMPIRLVWRLNISLRKRLAVSSIFALGLLACLSSLVRSYLIGVSFSSIQNLDVSWDLVPAIIAYHCEALFGMLAACAPSIKAAHGTLTHPTSTPYSSKTPRTRGSLSASMTVGGSRRGAATLTNEGDVYADDGSPGRCSSSDQSQNHAYRHDLDLQPGTSTLHLNPQPADEQDIPLQPLKPLDGEGLDFGYIEDIGRAK